MATDLDREVAPRPGSSAASRLIWRWDEAAVVRTRAQRKARLAAAIRAGIALVIAASLFALGHPVAASIGGVVGLVTGAIGLASPLGAYARLDRLVAAIAGFVATALTWLLLAPFFFLVITPFGWLRFRRARDPMKRRWDRSANTYWRERQDDRPSLDKPY